MEQISSLFRSEALNHGATERLGRVVLIRPVTFSALTGLAGACALTIILVLLFASYTKRAEVTGLLVPSKGLIKIYARQAGVVLQRKVSEGSHVKAGQPLFIISTGETTQHLGDQHKGAIATGRAILSTVRARKASLVALAKDNEKLSTQQYSQLRRQIHDMEAEIDELAAEIRTQEARVSSARKQYERYKEMADKHYIGALAAQQKKDELLDQKSRLQELTLNRLTQSRQLMVLKTDLAQIPTKAAAQQAQVDREQAEMNKEGLATEAQSRYIITAPVGGTVAAVLAQPGQFVGNEALLTILPKNSQLEADLYAPSRAAGFIRDGQRVRIKYRAYPYQEFGQYSGTVIGISRTALLAREMPAQLAGAAERNGNGGSFRIRVRLDSQFVNVRGTRIPLVAGSQLNASIMQERRTLLQWILEPIYSLGGDEQ